MKGIDGRDNVHESCGADIGHRRVADADFCALLSRSLSASEGVDGQTGTRPSEEEVSDGSRSPRTFPVRWQPLNFSTNYTKKDAPKG